MITYEITEFNILSVLSRCPSKITMHELFELIPEEESSLERAVTFINTLNQLLEMELVETTQTNEGMVYWEIVERGRQYLTDETQGGLPEFKFAELED